MRQLQASEAFERFKTSGRNSSHFVWFLDRFEFFEASNSWVFAYQRFGSVTLLALEPLIPDLPQGAPTQYSEAHREQFKAAWDEFVRSVEPKICAFIAVYSGFSEILAANGFSNLRVGQEPWMDLENCIPRGNAGKGVRSARNQALRKGLQVQQVASADLKPDSSVYQEIDRLHRNWCRSRLLSLKGYLNASDPFAYAEHRRYFVVRNAKGHCEGYLIATPIPGLGGYFLEDMVIEPFATKGVGELLTLEAMVALRDSGIRSASLGVVSMLGVGDTAATGGQALPAPIQTLVVAVPHLLRRIYNFDGLATFRKRFNPESWQNIYLCVKKTSGAPASTTVWLQVFIAMLRAFRPRLILSSTWILNSLKRPLAKYPVTWMVGILSFTLFGAVNHFGELPAWAATRFAFNPSAPLSQWFYRSVASDLIYFDQVHFIFCAIPLLALIYWAERTHTRRFVILFISFISVSDDFINFALVIKPFQYFQPDLFQHLIAMSDVGGSLWLAGLVGVQLCRLRKHREIIFAIICLISVFGFAYSSDHMKVLILNLNHFLFLSFGFIAGKIHFELERRRSRALSKAKPPEAKCVLTQ